MKRRILIHLDSDPQPSVFDRVVAVDAGAEELFSYGAVTLEQVTGLVHGAIFTRSPADLASTAIFIGGSDVAAGERMLKRVKETFLGPLRVSVILDSNGSNTTAAAAVLAARKHVELKGAKALVLGGTGPVGQRAARLLAGEGASVTIASRALDKAEHAAAAVRHFVPGSHVQAVGTTSAVGLATALRNVSIVIAAGAAGVALLPIDVRMGAKDLRVVIDLNAVPPLGIEGVDVMDKATQRDGVIAFGAIGVGGTKMKIHRAAVAKLFESTDHILDAEAIYAIGKAL